MTTVTISGSGAHASAAATDRIPASKAGVKGYLTPAQLATYIPSAANLWTILGSSGAAVSHTGSTTETALATIAVPAGAMGANGILRITANYSWTNSANNKSARIRFGASGAGTGGTQIFTSGNQASNSAGVFANAIFNRNSASSQIGMVASSSTSFNAFSSAQATAAINTANASEVVLTGLLANSGDTITLESYIVELFYKA